MSRGGALPYQSEHHTLFFEKCRWTHQNSRVAFASSNDILICDINKGRQSSGKEGAEGTSWTIPPLPTYNKMLQLGLC